MYLSMNEEFSDVWIFYNYGIDARATACRQSSEHRTSVDKQGEDRAANVYHPRLSLSRWHLISIIRRAG